jgi:hypothetical protein
MQVPNSEFYPSQDDQQSIRNDLNFHIVEALVKHIPFLQQYAAAVPLYIEHDHVEEMSHRHPYHIIDLLDKNESVNNDMIDISQEIHMFIPTIHHPEGRDVIERLVFGGDVLTNERAYGSELDVLNATRESERLLGLMISAESKPFNISSRIQFPLLMAHMISYPLPHFLAVYHCTR